MLKNILKISNDTKIEKPKLDVFENKMVCGRTYKTAI